MNALWLPRTRKSTAFETGMPGEIQTHRRVGSRTISSFEATITSSICSIAGHSAVSSISKSSDAGAGHDSSALYASGSDSKLGKHKRRWVFRPLTTRSNLKRIFMVAFLVCLTLFLHALSGFGVPDDVENGVAHGLHSESRYENAPVAPSVLKQTRSRIQPLFKNGDGMVDAGHDHLAVDPDGHYGFTSAYVGAGSAHRWATNQRIEEKYTNPTPEPAGGVKIIPQCTIDETRPGPYSGIVNLDEDASVIKAPPANEYPRGFATSESGDSQEVDLDLPLFNLGGPAHALRIHLPLSNPLALPDPFRRRRRVRASGQMVL